jgi:beta-glucosidase
MKARLDCVGFHYYTRRIVSAESELRIGQWRALRPHGMYDLVMRISRKYNLPIIEISENGCCDLDGPDGPDETDRVPDTRRISFHSQHLAELGRVLSR